MEVTGRLFQRLLAKLGTLLGLDGWLARGDITMMMEQLLEVLGTENIDFGKQKLTLNKGRVGIVKDGPDRYEILQLPASLLHDAVVASQDDGHAGQVRDLGVADDQRLNVEAASGNDTREARQDTRLILNQTIQNMTLGRVDLRCRGLIEDVGDGGLGRPRGRSAGDG